MVIEAAFREVLSSITVTSHQFGPMPLARKLFREVFGFFLSSFAGDLFSQILEISFLSGRIKSICHNILPAACQTEGTGVRTCDSGSAPLLQHQFNIKHQCYSSAVLVTVFSAAIAVENTFMKKCSKSIAVLWGWKSCLLSVFNSYRRLLAFPLLFELL